MTSWLNKYATYEEVVVGSVVGIVAFAGGGQASATALTAKFNQIDTCTTDENSVKLETCLIGKMQGVFNNTSQVLAVYPVSGQRINNVLNYKFLIAPGDYIEFRSYASGKCRSSEVSL